MRKLLLSFAMLLATVGAWADISQTWTSSDNWGNDVTDAPEGVVTAAASNPIKVRTTSVSFTGGESVTVGFTYSGGNCALCIVGVDLVNASGEVVANHYEYKHAGGDKAEEVYTLVTSSLEAGLYQLRYFVRYSSGDRLNDTNGAIAVTGVTEAASVVITYNYKWNGVVKANAQVQATVGLPYPAPSNLPYGVVAQVPEGLVAEDVTSVDIECTLDLPFEVSEDFGSAKWYYMTIHATHKNYLYYDASKDYLDASKTAVDYHDADAYRWAFIGNPFDGFKFVNKKAGSSMVLNSTEPTSDAVFPIMGESEKLWYLTSSSHATNGFYVAYDENSTQRLNRQNKNGLKVCYWLGGADAGSTFMVEECQKPHVEVMNYIDEFQSKYESLSLGWQDKVGYCTSQSLENLKVALESANALVKATSVLPEDKTISIGKMQQQMVPGRWYFIHTPRIPNTDVGAADYAIDGVIQSKGGLVTDNTNAVKVSATSTIDELKNADGVNANDYLMHLVRFVAVDDVEGAYRIEFGTGKWMGTDCGATQADVANAGQYNFYLTETDGSANTLGRFGWNKYDMANRVDNNGAGNGLAFWGNGKVTGTEGNNIWEIFEVNVFSVAVDESDQAIAALFDAIAALEIIQPEEGKFYTIQNAHSNVYMGVGNTAGMASYPEAGFGQVFQFVSNGEGALCLCNVERGTYLSTAPTHGGGQSVASATTVAEAKTVTIANLGMENRVSITPQGGAPLHHDASYSTVVGWNGDANSRSAWKIVEVEDMSALSHSVTITEAGWATLVLGCDATIPAGVKAYAVSAVGDGYATLTDVTGSIPANEAVLLNAAAGTYEFKYAAESTPVENELVGTVFDTNVAANAYVLSAQGDPAVVGFYKAQLNLEENTKFKNNAFKAYLPAATGGEARFLVFNFGDDNATAIEGIEAENTANAVVYDLAGRRVQNAQKGVFIVNGKVVIK